MGASNEVGLRMITNKLMAAAAAAVLALAAAGAAQAGDGSVRPNYKFPDASRGFSLRTSGGPVNPGVLVGFNPQPDPPGDFHTFLDLTDPTNPTLRNAMSQGDFQLVFSHLAGGEGPHEMPAPNSDGKTGFIRRLGDHIVVVTFDFLGGSIGEWSGFNPQPDPPGDFVAQDIHFAGPPEIAANSLDAFALGGARDGVAVTFHMSVDGTDLSFAATPEPTAWALMITGFGASGALLRRRRRAALAA
jgi:hypothetical protein